MTEYDPKLGLAVAFPKEEPRNVLARGAQRRRSDAASHRRDREVRARDLLLQRRARGSRSRERRGGSSRRRRTSTPTTRSRAMSAYEVVDCFEQTMAEHPFDFVVLNFANPDMVGAHRQPAGDHRGRRARRPLPGQGAGGAGGAGREGHRDRRPRQCRGHDRARRQQWRHGPQHQQGAAGRAGAWRRAARGRRTCRTWRRLCWAFWASHAPPR